ncbi:hypothetical protein REPUB_Repub08aG0066200 [Reevesia pubescens]
MDPSPTTSSGDKSEICFFDLETTVPHRCGQGYVILEFGAILVCPKRLVELKSYTSLVRPDDPSSISHALDRRNGITRDAVLNGPSFSEIADIVHDFLHGRVWAGHNILRFDCVRIREAFAKIGRPAPEPKRIIDSLALLTQRFGRRADLNQEIYSYIGQLWSQMGLKRSLDDVRMNLEVVKYCATVLFLESSPPDILTAESPELESPEKPPATAIAEGCSGYAGFLEPDEVSVTCISASLIPYYRGTHRIKLLHKDVAFQLFCPRLRVRLGPRTKFFDQANRPRLSFVVDASQSLCGVLVACDAVAKKISEDSGSNSEWRPVIANDYSYIKSPTVRLHIPYAVNGDIAQYATEIHQKDCSGTVQKLVFSKFDAEELGNIFRTGIFVDAFFSLDSYNFYQQSAGIRLVAKKLVIHSD